MWPPGLCLGTTWRPGSGLGASMLPRGILPRPARGTPKPTTLTPRWRRPQTPLVGRGPPPRPGPGEAGTPTGPWRLLPWPSCLRGRRRRVLVPSGKGRPIGVTPKPGIGRPGGEGQDGPVPCPPGDRGPPGGGRPRMPLTPPGGFRVRAPRRASRPSPQNTSKFPWSPPTSPPGPQALKRASCSLVTPSSWPRRPG